jgi:hypothetical protein
METYNLSNNGNTQEILPHTVQSLQRIIEYIDWWPKSKNIISPQTKNHELYISWFHNDYFSPRK